MERVYFAARYDKGTADYINCPMSKEEYERFYDALVSAEAVESKEWEKLEYFEGCLPIEELARRGRETLRFGPMKPVGLRDPRTGKIPWAVVQLRCENLRADSYNLVGLQNHLKFGEQARVLRLIPGLEKAKFLRFGQIHRNTYVNAPRVLSRDAEPAGPSPHSDCRPAVRGGRLYRIHCHRHAGRAVRRPAGTGRAGGWPLRVPRRWVRWCTTLPMPKARHSSRQILPSICWCRWKRQSASKFGTRKNGIGCNASGLWRFLTPGGRLVSTVARLKHNPSQLPIGNQARF